MAISLKGFPPAILLFTSCSFWGVATVLNKALLGSISPVLLLFLQLLASAVFLLTACFLLNKSMPKGKTLLVAIALGIMNPGVSYTFGLMGLERISASVTSLLWATEPFLILVLAWLILREPITQKVVAVISTGFFGVVLVSGLLSGHPIGQSETIGVLFLFIAVLLCAIYTVYSRKIGASVDALALVAVQQTAGLVWAAVLFTGTSTSSLLAATAELTLAELTYAAMVGLVYYALAYWLYLSALNRVSAALAGGSFNIIPIVTVAIAYVFLGERLSALQLFGALLIVIAATALFWLTREHKVSGQALAP